MMIQGSEDVTISLVGQKNLIELDNLKEIISNIRRIKNFHLDICQNTFAVVQDSFFIVYGSLLHLDTAGLDRELYCIDRNSADRMNVAFYKIFTAKSMMYLNLSNFLPTLSTYTKYLQQYELTARVISTI